LEPGVRTFSPERVRADLTMLLEAGVQTVKFVDRTFNADPRRAQAIWEFILAHNRGSSFHFEIAADLLSGENLELLRQVPPGTFRFEIGVQSTADDTLAAVGRRSDLARLFANVRRLRAETAVILHLDLVAGLPREGYAGFLDSLQQLLELQPHHIQVEPVKVLKGSPLRRIAAEQEYAYSDAPPYTVLQTPWLSFTELGRIGVIARLLDLLSNSGRFATALAALGETLPLAAAFERLGRFWEERELAEHLPLPVLFGEFWRFGESVLAGEGRERFRDTLCFDWCRADYPGSGPLPPFWREEDRLERQRDELASRVRTLQLPAGSRVRTFAARFGRDYTRQPWGDGPVELLFVYAASPGRGLTVHVLPLTS
jgi:anaerobic magnesium-protoporphyrin IX monomethyl ester cyclase